MQGCRLAIHFLIACEKMPAGAVFIEDRPVKLLPILLLALLPLTANALQVGERLSSWTLLDQYDQPYTLNNQTQTLLVARSMDAAKLVNAALQDKPKGFLESRHTVFVADIQKMPTIIAKMFAIPKMRDYSYRVMLDRDRPRGPRPPRCRRSIAEAMAAGAPAPGRWRGARSWIPPRPGLWRVESARA